MLRFTKRADYGLMAIHYIAIHDGARRRQRQAHRRGVRDSPGIAREDSPATRQAGADREPERAQGRVRADPASRRQISVGEVIRALEGPISIVSCLEDERLPADAALQPPAAGPEAPGGHHAMMLDTMSLAELTSQDVPELLSIARRQRRATDGVEVPDLHGRAVDHAVRSAGGRGDAPVLHREVRPPGQPQPPVRLGGGGRRRSRARADRRP